HNLAQNKFTYQSASKIQETYDVSVETLRRWATSGRMYTKPLEMTNNPRKRPGFVMQESVQSINETTLNNRSQISDNVIQDTKLSVTSVKDSIGDAGILLPFWNEYTLKESKKWWLPERTVCVALDPNLWSGSLKKNSTWLVILSSDVCTNDMKLENSQKTCLQSSQFQEESEETSSRQGTTHSPLSHPAGAAETQKMDGNSTMNIQSMSYRSRKKGHHTGKERLRAWCLNAVNFKNNAKLEWVLETPYDIRDEAMNDLKDILPTLLPIVHSKHWGRSRGEYAFLHKIKSAEPFPKQLEYDSRLVLNRPGEFYLCMPKPLEIWAENQGVIALDPGVRTFMTGYDPSGIAIK
ncbi:1268_t:CDS:2, partial [Ambispora gerdemannii]